MLCSGPTNRVRRGRNWRSSCELAWLGRPSGRQRYGPGYPHQVFTVQAGYVFHRCPTMCCLRGIVSAQGLGRKSRLCGRTTVSNSALIPAVLSFIPVGQLLGRGFHALQGFSEGCQLVYSCGRAETSGAPSAGQVLRCWRLSREARA